MIIEEKRIKNGELPVNSIILGDALNVMKKFPNCSIDSVVCDPPYVGTGTTAVAAKRLGRKYIGIDIDPQYVKISEKNLKQARETKINGCYVSIYLGQIRTMRDKDFKEIWKNRKGDLKFLENGLYKLSKPYEE